MKTIILICLTVLFCGCATSRVWKGGIPFKTERDWYITNTIRYQIIDNHKIAIWLEDRNFGTSDCDHEMSDAIRNTCIIYEFEKDMTKIQAKITKINLEDYLSVSFMLDKMSCYLEKVDIEFDDNSTNTCTIIDGKIIKPPKDSKTYYLKNARFKRTISITERTYFDGEFISRCIVTPITLSADAAVITLGIATFPIWFSLAPKYVTL